MTIPDYQTVMLPLLKLAADGQEHSLREAIERLADEFGLNEEERKELLPSARYKPQISTNSTSAGSRRSLRPSLATF